MRYNDEHLQIKILTRKNLDEVVEFLEEVRELELDEDEIKDINDILVEGYSFAVYDDGVLYSVILMYEASFDGIQILFDDEPNALSVEPHIDYSYDNLDVLERVIFRNINRIASQNGFEFLVIQLARTVREIRDSPNDIIRSIIRAGFKFIEAPDDVTIAFREVKSEE
ncbi:MAG: hypothetical protein QXV16_00920 [Candidatus Anstonellales archaeon]